MIETLIAVIWVYFILAMFWWVHIAQNNAEKKNATFCFKVSYREFKKIFDRHKAEYTIDNKFPHSLFGEDDKHYIHANIVKINNNLFYFRTPIAYFLGRWYIDSYTEKISPSKNEKFKKFKDYESVL